MISLFIAPIKKRSTYSFPEVYEAMMPEFSEYIDIKYLVLVDNV